MDTKNPKGKGWVQTIATPSECVCTINRWKVLHPPMQQEKMKEVGEVSRQITTPRAIGSLSLKEAGSLCIVGGHSGLVQAPGGSRHYCVVRQVWLTFSKVWPMSGATPVCTL